MTATTTITDADLTTDMIEQLRDEARNAGDDMTVEDCRTALHEDASADDVSSARVDARRRIVKVINDARAQSDA